MIIETSNIPLHEAIHRFLVANGLVKDWADLARRVNRSRSYFSTLKRTSSEPSDDVWMSLTKYMTGLLVNSQNDGIKRWLGYYIKQIEFHVMGISS
ncbi:MAG: hypothetical protein ACNI26_04075 [Terasakiella sp.]|uniref:hypothetical protein n=1 Tax=unclassified Terasakiella TaxID=2614952 RepID=UPI003B00B15F